MQGTCKQLLLDGPVYGRVYMGGLVTGTLFLLAGE